MVTSCIACSYQHSTAIIWDMIWETDIEQKFDHRTHHLKKRDKSGKDFRDILNKRPETGNSFSEYFQPNRIS